MNRKLFLVAALLFLAIFGSVLRVRAEDVEVNDSPAEEVHEYEETEVEEVQQEPVMYITSAPDVQTTVYFPEHQSGQYVAGEEVTALIGVTNTGDRTYNLSYVGAHLHSAYDYSFFIQNFTVRIVNQILPPQSEITVEYRFTPDERLEPAQFHLSGWVFYNATQPSTDLFRSTWVNSTVEVFEKPQEFTVATVFNYVLVAGVIGGAVYFFLLNKPSKRSKKSASSSAPSAEWTTSIYTPKPPKVPSNKAKKVSSKSS